MSDPSDPNNIVIRFEIQVPTRSGQLPAISVNEPTSPHQALTDPVQQLAAPEQKAPAPGTTTSFYGIDNPPNPARVQSGDGASGSICVSASNDFCPDLHKPTQVFILVQQPGVDIPSTPPGGASPATITAPGQWQHLGVAGARCLPPATAAILPWNHIIIWREYECAIGTWLIEILARQGVCAASTDCAYWTIAARSIFDTVAHAWTLFAHGFRGERLEVFNGVSQLVRLGVAEPGQFCWLLDGDGRAQPRIALVGHSSGPEPFELSLEHEGRRIVYKLPREEWNPIGINRFRLHTVFAARGQFEIPPTLEIAPA